MSTSRRFAWPANSRIVPARLTWKGRQEFRQTFLYVVFEQPVELFHKETFVFDINAVDTRLESRCWTDHLTPAS